MNDHQGRVTTPDFVLLTPVPDSAAYLGRRRGTPIRNAISAATGIPTSNLESAPLGAGLRIWFAEDFRNLLRYTPNHLADKVITALGYPADCAWRGHVTVSSDTDALLSDETIGTISKLAMAEIGTGRGPSDTPVSPLIEPPDDMWSPAEQCAPELLDVLMYMSRTVVNGRPVWQYEHSATPAIPQPRCHRAGMEYRGQHGGRHHGMARRAGRRQGLRAGRDRPVTPHDVME